MNKLKIKILLSLFLMTGFFIYSQTGITTTDSILSGGIYRKYRLYVPSVYNSNNSVPLLLNLHGYTSNATQQQLYGNFMPIADTANFIMALPEGTSLMGNQYFNAGFGGSVNDVLFINDLIDSLKLQFNIDNNCIYSCGMSNGGIMSYYLACNLQNKIAAIASVTGTMLKSWFSCAPNRPFPVMEIHGTMDATVPYAGDATFANTDSVVKKWALHNNCNLTPVTYSVPNSVLTDNSTAINYKYQGGNNGATVELYKVINGAHTWPGAPIAIGTTCMDFNASVEIWRFFRKYKLNMFVTGIDVNDIKYSFSIFPNPANNIIYIRNESSLQLQYTITDAIGNKLDLEIPSFNAQLSEFNVSGIAKGIYLIQAINNGKPMSVKKLVIN